MADVILYALRMDRRRIIELSDQAFGPHFLEEKHFEVATPETFLVALIDQRIVGFASCEVSKGEGNINTVAVDPKYKRRGVGSDLIYHCLLHLWNLGVRHVESQAWQRRDNGLVGLRSPLLANGFVEYDYDQDFYQTEEGDAICKVCGKTCLCGAFIYSLEMNDSPPTKPSR